MNIIVSKKVQMILSVYTPTVILLLLLLQEIYDICMEWRTSFSISSTDAALLYEGSFQNLIYLSNYYLFINLLFQCHALSEYLQNIFRISYLIYLLDIIATYIRIRREEEESQFTM